MVVALSLHTARYRTGYCYWSPKPACENSFQGAIFRSKERRFISSLSSNYLRSVIITSSNKPAYSQKSHTPLSPPHKPIQYVSVLPLVHFRAHSLSRIRVLVVVAISRVRTIQSSASTSQSSLGEEIEKDGLTRTCHTKNHKYVPLAVDCPWSWVDSRCALHPRPCPIRQCAFRGVWTCSSLRLLPRRLWCRGRSYRRACRMGRRCI
jgi:hypothetical protein